MPGKHGPNRLAKYLSVHDKWMRRFSDEGFVVADKCTFEFLEGFIHLSGSIECLGAMAVDVDKEIAVLSGCGQNARVQTRRFRYHAWVRGGHNILRYESAHDHRPCAHKHVYDTFGDGLERVATYLTEEDQIPTLGEVIAELRDWHLAHAAQFPRLR